MELTLRWVFKHNMRKISRTGWFALQNVNNKVTATTQTMPTNQTSVIQSTKTFKHSKSGSGNGNVNINQTQQQNNTAIPAVIKPQGGDRPDIKK